MSEINFLDNSNSASSHTSQASDGGDGVSKKIESQKNVKWIRPDKEKGEPGGDKERIKKSREEVLNMLDKGKKTSSKSATKESKKEKKKAIGFSLGRLFGFGQKNNKKEKEIKDSDVHKKSKTKEPEKDEKKAPEQNLNSERPFVFDTNTWNAPGVLETNLMNAGEFGFFDSGKKLKLIVIGILIAGFSVAALYQAIIVWEYSEYVKIREVQGEIRKIENVALKMEKEISAAKVFQRDIKNAVSLLHNHIYWTNFFAWLEKNTLEGVYYIDGFTASRNNEDISLRGVAKNYEMLKAQLLVMSDDENSESVEASNMSYFEKTEKALTNNATTSVVSVDEGIGFNLNIVLKKNIFNKSFQASSSLINHD